MRGKQKIPFDAKELEKLDERNDIWRAGIKDTPIIQEIQ
jgi:hypothetical protein